MISARICLRGRVFKMRELYVDYLYQLLKNQTHKEGKTLRITPFSSRSKKKIRGNFIKVIGEFVRRICDFKVDYSKLKEKEFSYLHSKEKYGNNKIDEMEEQFLNHISEQVKFQNDDDHYDFLRFLKEYFFDKDSIKIIHPFFYNYIRVDDNNNEYSKYGKFMRDVLISNKEAFKRIFSNNNADNILTQLLINQNKILVEINDLESEYQPLIPQLIKLYEEDILFISNHRDFFLKSFSLITHFYVFMYICQLVVKFERFFKANYDTLDSLYFTLEWESLNRRRKAVDNIDSFKFIKNNLPKLFPHVHTLSQLSHNTANVDVEDLGRDNKIRVLTYPEIKQYLLDGILNEELFLSDLHDWMIKYTSIFKKEFPKGYEPKFQDVDEALKEMFDLVNKGTSDDVCKKYGGNLEDLGAYEFIKNRGSLGQVFNISYNLLIVITAVSVKNERIPLNQLFLEYERRGIKLDNYSKDEVVKALDKLNLIDKKSDSGDAQYVKPIL